MFDWYRKAAWCYVYLSDVSSQPLGSDQDSSTNTAFQVLWDEDAFRSSRWFTRGWTLQELLAPASVQFFSENGSLLGTKATLARLVSDITGISRRALHGRPSDFDVETRFAWAKNRDTQRPEDQAYCLFDIFGVRMTLHYGEGMESALARLRRKIDRLNDIPQDSELSETEPAWLLYVPPKMCRTKYLSFEVQVQRNSETYDLIAFNKANVEKRRCHTVLHQSGEELSHLPQDFQQRFRRAEAEVLERIDLEKWRFVYWEERRCGPLVATMCKYISRLPKNVQGVLDNEVGELIGGLLLIPTAPAFLQVGLLENQIFEFEFILEKRHQR
ncbi:uncharacterized protein A1O5_10614 [Cladophialophora psammophila CBS 110553]|uniref:Heterokaryon incompatibility domain-containing protein n=1 Tax=Cladophialophora psammophila CBS 110553 TaxID=1182543 RepID=W9WEC1_9EURO|nr:uncharacterized protein A1O5_10614 [Cladophialophora psammophila CBS 110553]EXJ66462.1 hypothetical protein A1O5_10614 [Cladophialophora psammophila CBS 110553]